MTTLIPCTAGDLKQGGYVQINGHPCKIITLKKCKTGKHGVCKIIVTGTDVLTDRKYNDAWSSSHGVLVPTISRDEYQLVHIEDQFMTVMTEGGDQLDEPIPLPDKTDLLSKLITAFNGGEHDVIVTVLRAPVGVSMNSPLEARVVDIKCI